MNAERKHKIFCELSTMNFLTLQNEYIFLMDVLDDVLEQRDSYRNKCRSLLNNNSYRLEDDQEDRNSNLYDELI